MVTISIIALILLVLGALLLGGALGVWVACVCTVAHRADEDSERMAQALLTAEGARGGHGA